MSNRAGQYVLLILPVLVLMMAHSAAGTGIIYVDDSATGPQLGTSWDTAYMYLYDALADANSSPKPVEIRVAQGVYKPDQGGGLVPGDINGDCKVDFRDFRLMALHRLSDGNH